MLQSTGSGFSSGGLQAGGGVPHSKVLEKVEAQRTEINDLQARLSSLETRQIDYEQTLSCVDRQWTQINEDIIYMSQQARGFGNPESDADMPEASVSEQDHPTGTRPT
jgi:chromosome segregation ATPase